MFRLRIFEYGLRIRLNLGRFSLIYFKGLRAIIVVVRGRFISSVILFGEGKGEG